MQPSIMLFAACQGLACYRHEYCCQPPSRPPVTHGKQCALPHNTIYVWGPRAGLLLPLASLAEMASRLPDTARVCLHCAKLWERLLSSSVQQNNLEGAQLGKCESQKFASRPGLRLWHQARVWSQHSLPVMLCQHCRPHQQLCIVMAHVHAGIPWCPKPQLSSKV